MEAVKRPKKRNILEEKWMIYNNKLYHFMESSHSFTGGRLFLIDLNGSNQWVSGRQITSLEEFEKYEDK